MEPSVKVQIGTCSVTLDARSSRALVGRDSSCTLVADEMGVSRRHAELYLEDGQVYIRDLGSANGTWVDGVEVRHDPAPLRPGQQVFVGTAPLGVQWEGAGAGATVVGALPPDLKALIDAHRAKAAAPPEWAPPPLTQEAYLGVGGSLAPKPESLTYRRQGGNNNGTLLIALPGDTFSNAAPIQGHVEYTALDNENVSSILLELVEHYKGEPKGGHVWDRVLVRQGPWKSRKGDVLGMPFTLRVPPGTNASGGTTTWEIRGLVDIAWAFDVECDSPITMRNAEVDRLRDALGALDYRVVSTETEPLGQRFNLRFQPPATQSTDLTEISLTGEYMGSDVRLTLGAKRTGMLKGDRKGELTFALERLRNAPPAEIGQYLQQQVDVLTV